MTPETQTYIENEILPHVGFVEVDEPPFITIPALCTWLQSSLRLTVPITIENLQNYLLQDNEGLIQRRRNIYLSWKEFDALPIELLGTEARGNFHKLLLTVIILPCDLLKDGEFSYWSDDEFMILKEYIGV